MVWVEGGGSERRGESKGEVGSACQFGGSFRRKERVFSDWFVDVTPATKCVIFRCGCSVMDLSCSVPESTGFS